MLALIVRMLATCGVTHLTRKCPKSWTREMIRDAIPLVPRPAAPFTEDEIRGHL